MFKVSFESTSSATTLLNRVRARGLYRQPEPLIEFDCNIEEFDCCHRVMLGTDMTILDEGLDMLTDTDFMDMFDMPALSDSEFMGLHEFLHDYHR